MSSRRVHRGAPQAGRLECAAIIEIAGKLEPALKPEEESKQLERLTAMLIRLTRSCDT